MDYLRGLLIAILATMISIVVYPACLVFGLAQTFVVGWPTARAYLGRTCRRWKQQLQLAWSLVG